MSRTDSRAITLESHVKKTSRMRAACLDLTGRKKPYGHTRKAYGTATTVRWNLKQLDSIILNSNER